MLRIARLAAAASSYAVTGQAAGLARSLTNAAAPGALVVTGINAELVRVSSSQLAASPGVFLLTGTAAALSRSLPIAASVGAVAITGQSVELLAPRRRVLIF
jgi:hypothetical protein